MKKRSTALLVSIALMATGAQAQWRGNWLLGVSADHHRIDLKDNDEDDSNGFLINGITETDFAIGEQSRKLWAWEILGGYQARCNGWLLGAEFAVEWIKSKDDSNSFAFTSSVPARAWAGSASFGRKCIFALTGRIGYDAYPYLMPYLRAGVETSRDKLNFDVSTIDGALPFITAQGDTHVQSWRFIGGVGVEVPLPVFCGFTLRGEWDFLSNGRSIDVTALASDNVTLISLGGKQEINTAKLSLVYNFPV